MSTPDPKPSYVTPSLKLANEALAIELLTSNTSNAVTGFMPRIFKSAASGLAGFLAGKFDYFKAKSLGHDQEKILLKLQNASYSVIAGVEVTTLEGFCGTYLEYSKQILQDLTFYNTYTEPDLARYKLLIGDIITNRSARLDLIDLTRRYRATEKAREESDKSNAEFFAAGSHKAIQPIGKVVERITDLGQVFGNAQEIITKIKAIDPDAVKGRVNEINDLIELLVGEIDAKNITELSKSQIQNLSQGIMELAYQIEHFSLTYYRAVTFVTAISRLTEALEKV